MSEPPENWLALQEQLLSGDRVAFARLNRLIAQVPVVGQQNPRSLTRVRLDCLAMGSNCS